MAKATLANPETGERKAVEVGSKDAQNLFGQGFKLEQSFDPATGISTFAEAPTIKAEMPERNVDPSRGQETLAEEMTRQRDSSTLANLATAEAAQNQVQQDIAVIQAKQQQEISSELEQAKQREESAALGLQETKFDALETESMLRKRLDLQAKEEKLVSIQSEINAEKTRLQQEEITIENKPILGSIIRGQKALAQRQAYAKIQALAMEGDVVSGQLDRAQNRLNNLMGYMRDSVETERENYKVLLDLANRDIVNLSNEERDVVNSQLNSLENRANMLEERKDNIRNLQLQNPTAFAKAGINLAVDDYDTIINKFTSKVAETTQVENLMTKYWDAGILPSDSLQTAQNKAKSSSIYRDEIRGPVGNRGLTASQLLGIIEKQQEANIDLTEQALDEDSAFVALVNQTDKTSSIDAIVSYAKNKGATAEGLIDALYNLSGTTNIEIRGTDIVNTDWINETIGTLDDIRNKFKEENTNDSSSLEKELEEAGAEEL